MHTATPAVLVTAVASAAAHAALFQPDSATAGSEFSGNYLIDFAINGTGLPDPFTPSDVHATYARNNHWTTRSGALAAGTAFADFFFDTPKTVGTFYLWNHLSNGIASDPGYAVTLFDLELFDAADNPLGSITNVAADPDFFAAQAFGFAPIDNVSRVKLTILANNGSPQYTGVGEVAFDSLRIPTPASAALLAAAALVGTRRRR